MGVVDFYCHKADLIIEVDGSVHEEDEQKESDAERDKALGEMGLRVFRFKNEEIIGNLRGVLEKIRELILE